MRLAGCSTVRSLHAVAFCALAAASCWGGQKSQENSLQRFEFTQPHMGTLFKIVFYASNAPSALRASQAAFDRIAELDRIMSDYQPSSELMQVSQQAGGPPARISDDLYRVLSAAQEIAQRSEGAFDITVGPVVRLWRRARRQHELPDPTRLAQALELVGYGKLRLDVRARTAQLLKPGMLLDLGGIGKGYAADETLRLLKQHGINRALVAAGGDIALGEPPPHAAAPGWTIAVASLDSPAQEPKRYVTLRNAGISTSGDLEQHVDIDGTRYSHIVDPKTGRAKTGRVSVTVIAPDDTTADALATAVCVLGLERGLKLIKSMPQTRALICQQTDGGPECFDWHFPRTGTVIQGVQPGL
jgi:thiamine biosynthesis lipoprotein